MQEQYRFVIFRYKVGKDIDDDDTWTPRRELYKTVYQSKKWYDKSVDCALGVS